MSESKCDFCSSTEPLVFCRVLTAEVRVTFGNDLRAVEATHPVGAHWTGCAECELAITTRLSNWGGAFARWVKNTGYYDMIAYRPQLVRFWQDIKLQSEPCPDLAAHGPLDNPTMLLNVTEKVKS